MRTKSAALPSEQKEQITKATIDSRISLNKNGLDGQRNAPFTISVISVFKDLETFLVLLYDDLNSLAYRSHNHKTFTWQET